MSVLSGINDFFGLDIGTSSIRLVQLKGGGHGSVKELVKYAHVPIDPKISLSESKADQLKVTQTIRQMIKDANLSTNNVAVGLPSGKVFSTVVDMDKLSPQELAQTIIYQADSLIPTPVAESKIDWVLLGDSQKDKNKVEVLLTSVSNTFTEARLDMLESMGLNVIAFEPDSIALLRALIDPAVLQPILVIDVGSKSTDLVITMNGAPRLIRSIPTGIEAVLRAASQNLNISEEQANQFVFKFGLSPDKLEGQVRGAIIGTVDILISEIDKSIKFFQQRYAQVTIDRIIVTSGASALPELPLYIASKFNMNVEIGNAWRNVAFAPERKAELMPLANYFGVAVGLAERQL